VTRSSVSDGLADATHANVSQRRYVQEYLQDLDIFHLLAEEEIMSSNKGESVFFLYNGFHGIPRDVYLDILGVEIEKKRHH